MIGNLFFLVGVAFAERLIYLPSTGFCLMAGLAISVSWRAGGRLGPSAAIAGRAAVGLALVAVLAPPRRDGPSSRPRARRAPAGGRACRRIVQAPPRAGA